MADTEMVQELPRQSQPHLMQLFRPPPLPKFYGGIDNNLTYHNFDFSLNLTYALDFYIYNGSKAGLRDQRWWNNSVEVYKTAWKNPGDVTHIPKPVWG